MKVSELWVLTTFVGRVRIEKEGTFETIVEFPPLEMSSAMFKLDHEYRWLRDKEVAWFDFALNTMRIIIKGE